MRKALYSVAFLALFFAIFSLAKAEGVTNLPIEETTSTPTKWEILDMMQHAELTADTIYKASFTESELNDLFERQLTTYKMKWFVERARVVFLGDEVELTARVLRPIPGNLTVKGKIEVVEGKAEMAIDSAWYGYFPAPASFVERVGNFVMKKKSRADWFSIGDGTWNSVSIKDDTLSFEVRGPDSK
jgi:hypothetical protein